MSWTGQMFWLLAYGSALAEHTFFPPSPPPDYFRRTIGHGKSYPVTAAQLLPIRTGFLAPIHCLEPIRRVAPIYEMGSLSSQRTESRTSGLRLSAQDLFNQSPNQPFAMPSADSSPNFAVTGGAGFIGSNLTLALQEKFPEARLTVIDDFRSGDFKNLAGYRGDLVTQNLATLDWQEKFGDERFDAIFHLASITDTTNHDQFEQVHDNVESFRRLLNFARPTTTRIIYASSASTYGAVTEASTESNGAAPANVYSFSKVIMDNIARRAAAESPDWIIIGLRY